MEETFLSWNKLIKQYVIDLSVIIPCYNEQVVIKDTFIDVYENLMTSSCIGNFEIILIDDGSVDSTYEILQEIKNSYQDIVDDSIEFLKNGSVKIIHGDKNIGKGFRIRDGIRSARYKNICFMDADNSASILNVLAVSNEIYENNKMNTSYMLIGDRCGQVNDRKSSIRALMSYCSRKYVENKFHFGSDIDTQCGFKIFDKDTGKMLSCKQTIFDFAFDVEYIAIAKMNKVHIDSFAIVWHDNFDRRSSVKPIESSVNFMKDCDKIKRNMRSDIYLMR